MEGVKKSQVVIAEPKTDKPTSAASGNTSPSAQEVAPSATIVRSKRIVEAAKRIVQGSYPYPMFLVPSETTGVVKGLALILCQYGDAPERIAAARRALSWTLKAQPSPEMVVLVEAQEEGVPYVFEDIKVDAYIQKRIPENSKGCWKKEALWNIGAAEALRNEHIDKLCFLDIDCIFADQAWATAVAEALDEYEIISPHEYMYYAEQEDAVSLGLQISAGGCLTQRSSGCYGLPGLSFAMTKDFFVNRLHRQLPNICVGSGDTYLWTIVAGKGRFAINSTQFAHTLTTTELEGMHPAVKIGTAYQVAVHCNHGPFGHRCYRPRMVISRAAAPTREEATELNEDGIPVWKDTPGGRILRQGYPELLKLAKTELPTTITARDIYDRLAMQEYGPIDEDHPFIVACMLRSGGKYTEKHVRWLKRQFDLHCKAPFIFYCISDVEIEGINTIPLLLSNTDAPTWWGQIEFYRNIWPANASVLTCDLDTVIFRDFTPHRCPENKIFMLREQGNWNKSVWAIWGGGLTYFNGDYSFIFDSFKADTETGAQRSPLYSTIASQEYVTSCLRSKGIVPEDVESHFCYSYYQGVVTSIRPEAHFAIFASDPKPWDILPRPCWVPPLDEPVESTISEPETKESASEKSDTKEPSAEEKTDSNADATK